MTKRGKILLVDDEPALRLLLSRALDDHEITLAADGKEALEKFESDTYDLLISDCRLPGVHGPELAAVMQSIQPTLAVLLTSASETPESIQVCAPALTFRFLSKPFDLNDFTALVGDVLSSHLARNLDDVLN